MAGKLNLKTYHMLSGVYRIGAKALFIGFLIPLLLVFDLPTLSAQDASRVDSLKNRLESTDTDTIRFRAMMDLAGIYRKRDLKKAVKYAEKASSLARSMKDSLRIARSLGQMAINYTIIGKYDQSVSNFQEAKELFESKGKYPLAAQTLNNVGFAYIKMGEHQKARESFEQALSFYRKDTTKKASKDGLAFTYGRLATLQNQQGDHLKALRYHRRSYNMYRKMDKPNRIANKASGLANDFSDLGMYDSARVYYQKALETNRKLGDSVSVTVGLHNLANLYVQRNEIESAKEYIQRAISMSKTIGMPAQRAKSYAILGDVHRELNQPDSAFRYYQKSLMFQRKTGEKNNIAESLARLSRLMIDQGQYEAAQDYINEALKLEQELDNRKLSAEIYFLNAKLYKQRNQNERALDYLDNAIKVSETIRSMNSLSKAYRLKSEILREQGRYESALQAFQQYKTFDDSLFNKQKNETIARIETQYQVQRTKRENRILQEKQKRQREELSAKQARLEAQSYRNYLLTGGVISLSIILLLLGWNWYYQRTTKQKLQQKNDRIAEQNRELQELIAFKNQMFQMIVHDLKNPLTAIIGMAESDVIKQSGQRILRMVNNILEVHKLEKAELKTNIETFEVEEVIEEVHQQLSPMLRMNDQEVITRIDDENFVEADRNLTYRTLENLVSNAMKYSPAGSTIQLSAQSDNGYALIEVTDEGPGISVENQKNIFDQYWSVEQGKDEGMSVSAGLGLAFCKMAVELQDGSIGVESKEGEGSTFWFTLKNKPHKR